MTLYRPLHQLLVLVKKRERSGYNITFCSAVVQARTKGLLWKTKVLEKKKATQLNLSGPQDNLNKTIIDGATVREYTVAECIM